MCARSGWRIWVGWIVVTLGPIVYPSPGRGQAVAPGAAAPAEAAAPLAHEGSGAGDEGMIMVDLPHQVHFGETFEVDVWTRGVPGETDVFMEQTPDVVFEPRTVRVSATHRATVKCNLTRDPPSGLLEINLSADRCANRSLTIDAGFRLKLARIGASDGVTSDAPQMLELAFTDDTGRPVPLDGPLEMRMLSSMALLHDGPQSPATNSIVKHVERRSVTAPYVWLAPQLRAGQLLSVSTTDVAVELRDSFTDKILGQRFLVTIRPPTWIQIVAAIAGSLVWMLLASVVQPGRHAQKLAGLISALLTGVVAFALVRIHVLGANVDTTEVWGFFILGALVNSSGVESFLRGLTSKVTDTIHEKAAPAAPTAPRASRGLAP
jgi:hypothetical protein